MRINIDKSKRPLTHTLNILGKNYKLEFKERMALVNDNKLNPIYRNRLFLDIYDQNNELILKNERLVFAKGIGLYLSNNKGNKIRTGMPDAYITPDNDDDIDDFLEDDYDIPDVDLENLDKSYYIDFVQRGDDDWVRSELDLDWLKK